MKILITLNILILITLEYSCTSKNDKLNIFDIDSISKEKQRITLINDTSQIKWFIDDYNGFWTLNYEQNKVIDSIIIIAIKEKAKDFHKRLTPDKYKGYFRQYVCYIDSNGDSIVYINAICRVGDLPIIDEKGNTISKRDDWQHELIHVMDGGDCYWCIWINYTRRSYKDFIINGLA